MEEHRKVIEAEFEFIKVNNKYSDEDIKRNESIIKSRSKTWGVEKEGNYIEFVYYCKACKNHNRKKYDYIYTVLIL